MILSFKDGRKNSEYQAMANRRMEDEKFQDHSVEHTMLLHYLALLQISQDILYL